jgi:hypothetical protein
MNLALLGDPLLWLIMAMAGFVTMATSLQVATRPAAVRTGRIGTALSMGQIVFIITRFGNMFYMPLLGNYVDQASRSGDTATLVLQMRWVIVGSAGGALVALFLLPTFIELVSRGVHSVSHRRMLGALLNLVRSRRAWGMAAGSLRRPSLMGSRFLRLKGLPKTFLLANIVATSIWTVGALAAITTSGLHPELKQTALLLSGLVNSFAAIAFSVLVDPQAAIITDQAHAGKRPKEHVTTAAVHLVMGNFLGAALGTLLLGPAVKLITAATLAIGSGVTQLDSTIGYLIAANAFIWLLMGTDYSCRVSGSRTGKVAIAISVFNFFSLISRVAGQVYGPFVGAVTDQLTHRPSGQALSAPALEKLEHFYRGLISGSTVGCLLSILLLPTFVKIYQVLIEGLDHHQSLPVVLLKGLDPRNWPAFGRLLTAPWKQAVSRKALARIPKGFLWANVVVLGFQTCSQLAAIYAGATFAPEIARTTTLLSPLINGFATIVLSLVVDPTGNILVDQAVAGERPKEDIETMTFWLAMGAVGGTLLSQLLFIPAAWLISSGAQILDAVLKHA